MNLIKVCSGVSSAEDVRAAVKQACAAAGRSDVLICHATRNYPGRAEELLLGGSLYWIIKGRVTCRQAIVELRKDDRSGQCLIILGHDVVDVRPAPRRPFQGWRYLQTADAPPDIGALMEQSQEMPEDMRRELAGMGLI
ncbi:conserved hypothetical protein [Hyphomicrobiales bacterium]|jgi:hypothetical protein|nr:conserved hypothetical protein [Hyphomicrobiales bacterium]CAH1702839.1 conserved hypothetical protein [Hyphomicrobiales bacterium]CAI0347027.1 conserved hypothetical protein [Hyphomicrobiales bacterium]